MPWIRVCGVDELPEGEATKIEAKIDVAVFNVDGEFFATQDVCSHGSASLADGFIVDGDKIECPLHQGTFDITTGKAVGIPCKIDLRTYAVKVENGNIFIKE